MLDTNIIFIVLIINAFGIGYLIGKSINHYVSSNDKPSSFFQQNNSKRKETILIDDKKFVTDIKTQDLEKKYDSLGDITQTSENVTDAVHKLKNLKR